MKNIVCFIYCLAFALFFSLQAGLMTVSAAQDDKVDVYISVGREVGYKYATDIIFKNISFVYQLESIAVNSKTGEQYVNSGRWTEHGGAPSPSFDVVVINRSDTPIYSETVFFAADFDKCGAGITAGADGEKILPAVLLEAGKTTVYERKTRAVFGVYPELSSYKGEKHISATVKIDRADGVTTEGYPFVSRKK